ncbi:DUF916 domain-containing protein [Myceligenerans pegani]|uniref:DUF916 domain-containing protein n=1 Tax=Myceligenerans pegani TaxID=2776917 RepID=A0ABR9N1X4_9MICO|nr:DUF916 domain-containing protein [Myceligenerans sp. TRM 65318]MBE1877652.1 DUF916 domain-containing protein [Myceligenerans sp. TRM 65318]MBE3019923.1 DUF916 domain-containing protein [Myceligenerans sp. TRM 65318]
MIVRRTLAGGTLAAGVFAALLGAAGPADAAAAHAPVTEVAARAGVASVVVPSAVVPTGVASADDREVTWSVQPSGPDGRDGRTELAYDVAPGTTISDWVSVSNFSDRRASFRVYGADATTDYDTGAFTLIAADQASTDLGSWTSVDSGAATCPDTDDDAEAACAAELGVVVRLEPGARADIPFTITVPHDATPGDHAAGIVASFRSGADDGEGSAVQLEQRVGTRIYLRVDGETTPALDVTGVVAGFDGAANPFGAGTATVGFDLTNTGNTRISGEPEVRVSGPFGIGLGSIETEPVENLVPGGTAHVSAEVPGVAPLLLLFADVTVTPAAAASPGGGADDDALPAPVRASAQAWAVPWPLAGVVALLAGGTWAVVAWRRRSRRLLGEELAAWTEQVRAETLAEARSDAPAPTTPGQRSGAAPAPDHESEALR